MDVNGIVIRVPLQLNVGISPSSNRREQMVVNGGMKIRVPMQLKVGISPSSNGREQMVVPGISGHVPEQLVVGIFPSYNGREQMVGNRMKIRVPKQLLVGISSSSNGPVIMVVTGTKIHLWQLRNVLATKTCSITLLMKGALPGMVQLIRLAICIFTSIAKPRTLKFYDNAFFHRNWVCVFFCWYTHLGRSAISSVLLLHAPHIVVVISMRIFLLFWIPVVTLEKTAVHFSFKTHSRSHCFL
jgi:hypothetical protein